MANSRHRERIPMREHVLNRHFVMAGAAFDFDVALHREETVAGTVFRDMWLFWHASIANCLDVWFCGVFECVCAIVFRV